VSKIQTEFPAALGDVRDSHQAGFAFYLKPEYGGGVIAFRNLDDPTKYQSAEFAAVAVDELLFRGGPADVHIAQRFDTVTRAHPAARADAGAPRP
jgi:hypothetical protein